MRSKCSVHRITCILLYDTRKAKSHPSPNSIHPENLNLNPVSYSRTNIIVIFRMNQPHQTIPKLDKMTVLNCVTYAKGL